MITRKILCLPQTISSTAGGLVTQTIEQRDNGPLAMLFSERADSLASGGAILADIWVGKRIDGVDKPAAASWHRSNMATGCGFIPMGGWRLGHKPVLTTFPARPRKIHDFVILADYTDSQRR